MALVTMQDVLKVAEEKKLRLLLSPWTLLKWQRRSLPLQKKSNFRQS